MQRQAERGPRIFKEDHVSSISASGRSSGKTIITIVLGIIAVLALVVAIIYFIEPAHSLPSILGAIKHPPARANSHRPLRGAGMLVIAVVCLVGAFFVARSNKSSVGGTRDTDAVEARR